jgi:hypothetical protein
LPAIEILTRCRLALFVTTGRKMTARLLAGFSKPAHSREFKEPQKPVRDQAIFSNGFKLIWAVQPYAEKYFCFLPTQITGLFVAIHPERGAYHDRHERGVECGGRNGVRCAKARWTKALVADGEAVWS